MEYDRMIRLKRWGSVGEHYVYVRPDAVLAMWGDGGLVEVEVSGREDPFRIEGEVADVAAKLGLTLID